MSIVKHEIPILEYDDSKTAVINPTHEKLGLQLPKKCVFAFLGGYIDEYAEKVGACPVGHFKSMTKLYPVYVIKYRESVLQGLIRREPDTVRSLRLDTL